MSENGPRLSYLPDFPGRECLYRPLDASKMEIRVITIVPCTERSAPISCSLQIISIQDGRERGNGDDYNAISYYWGSTAAEDLENIIVSSGDDSKQGYEVPVTKQLTGALRQFRSNATVAGCALVLWTDAVCINQLDAEERAQQVIIMRSIYAAAFSTWIWLGDSDPDAEKGLANLLGLATCQESDTAGRACDLDALGWGDHGIEPDLESLRRVWAAVPTLPVDARVHWEHRKWLQFFQDIKKVNNFDVDNIVRTVSTLLGVRYWTRGWVIQEARANPLNLLHYGQTRRGMKEWDSLCQLMLSKGEALTHLKGSSMFLEFRSFLFLKPDSREDCDTFMRYRAWLDLLTPTVTAMLSAHKTHAPHEPALARFWGGTTWNHDAYASLGRLAGLGLDFATDEELSLSRIFVTRAIETLTMENDWQTTDPRDYVYARLGYSVGFMLLRLVPDYTMSAEEVYIAATISALRATRSLSHPQLFVPSASPYLPSWCIDFTHVDTAGFSSYWFDRWRSEKWKAGYNTHFRLEQLRPRTILVSGFLQDRVAAISPLYNRLLDDATTSVLQQWEACATLWNQHMGTKISPVFPSNSLPWRDEQIWRRAIR